MIAKEQMAGMIDHTELKSAATREQIATLCEQAKTYHFASVCIEPCYIPLAAELLKGTGVAVCTVIGFPLGVNATETKAFETAKAIQDGATEVDMVINVGKIKDGDWDYVRKDVAAVVDTAKGKALTKVILEVCLLTDEEIVQACRICKDCGADFVKTSTGFSTGGATVEAVRLMRETVGPDMGVKAAGGIRTTKDALAMIEAGANRLGASAGMAIIQGLSENPPA